MISSGFLSPFWPQEPITTNLSNREAGYSVQHAETLSTSLSLLSVYFQKSTSDPVRQSTSVNPSITSSTFGIFDYASSYPYYVFCGLHHPYASNLDHLPSVDFHFLRLLYLKFKIYFTTFSLRYTLILLRARPTPADLDTISDYTSSRSSPTTPITPSPSSSYFMVTETVVRKATTRSETPPPPYTP
ncbi:hypothetical protein K469DRAFT_690526 [Zopfia rhizophila CBS 207.26]|uniref:Uncharacterized protein n=1 Tax=Zopfia rhizophila CBS 207.26 TaxID=1314779 RepID=A0A6A6DUS1_9PEZI|nr:hypothetical protein K469DRAFT_690526 [Zopfia rhizophila CBS 207.26]